MEHRYTLSDWLLGVMVLAIGALAVALVPWLAPVLLLSVLAYRAWQDDLREKRGLPLVLATLGFVLGCTGGAMQGVGVQRPWPAITALVGVVLFAVAGVLVRRRR